MFECLGIRKRPLCVITALTYYYKITENILQVLSDWAGRIKMKLKKTNKLYRTWL